MYSISMFGTMINDQARTDAYAQALRRAVKPGSVVLDIGTGTGVFALLACQYGAAKVYAIEPDDAIQAGREIAGANGLSERIQFIQAVSTEVSLPEKVDIIVSDIRGLLPLYQAHIPTIADARRRFLSPGGVLIPQSDTLWAGLASAPDLYEKFESPWENNKYELDLQAARKYVVNSWNSGRVQANQLLAEAVCWANINYYEAEDPNITAEISWTVTEEGTAHGLVIWFDTQMIEGIGFTNAPGSPNPCTVYGSGFFPLLQPVPLKVGDQVLVTLSANLVAGEYIWDWHTRVLDQGVPGQVTADFQQSTFYKLPISLEKLRKRGSNFVPTLSEDGQIRQLVFSLMDGRHSLQEIAEQVTQRFPKRFPTWQVALPQVGEISLKFSQ